MLVGQREKSQKYFDLSAFNKDLNDSVVRSSLGVMNFQKWELFSGSPGGVGPSITIVYTRTFYKVYQSVVRFAFSFRVHLKNQLGFNSLMIFSQQQLGMKCLKISFLELLYHKIRC